MAIRIPIVGEGLDPPVSTESHRTTPHVIAAGGGKWGPRKSEWLLWGEEKPRYRWNFLLAGNVTLYLVL